MWQKVRNFVAQPGRRKWLIILILMVALLVIPFLAQIIQQKVAINPDWNGLLAYLGHPAWQGFGSLIGLLALAFAIYEKASTPKPPVSPPPAPPLATVSPPSHSKVPPPTYTTFVGRTAFINELQQRLSTNPPPNVIALTGMGGTGKTALAREIIEHPTVKKGFEHIVWLSAKTEFFEDEKGATIDPQSVTFDGLLDEIAKQCQQLDFLSLLPEKKREAIRAFIHQHRILITIDNLDTVPNYEALVKELQSNFLGYSRVLITSRHAVQSANLYLIPLGGLDEQEGLKFLRSRAAEIGAKGVQTAREETLKTIHLKTGGLPLAMRLVVGQTLYDNLETVLKRIMERAYIKEDTYKLYRFIYQHSWTRLGEVNPDAQELLMALAPYEPPLTGAKADVQAISKLADLPFETALGQLVQMSLVNMVGPAGQERYGLHPLTYYFIRSDVTKEWQQGSQ